MSTILTIYFLTGIIAAYSEYRINRLVFKYPLSLDKNLTYAIFVVAGFLMIFHMISNFMILRDMKQ